jgi:hypothetical protein
MKELQEIQKNLKAIIPFKWRVQSFSKFKAQATCVSYIDSRDVQDILDASCVWSDRYYSEGGLLFCEITIYADGREYKRTDTGSESNVDKQKGHSSDAFKRAAVKFGVGRFLYSQKIQYVTADAIKTSSNYPNVIDAQGNKIWDLTKHINLKAPTPPKKVEDRKEALTDIQFEKSKGFTKEQIKTTLGKFRMSTDQRTELTKLSL